MSIPYLACMAAAAAFYHLPPRVLPSIQAVEGGHPGSIHPNSNGTADLGLMQVNTIWIDPLSQYIHMKREAVTDRLVNDSCFNIAAAAFIMRFYLTEARGDLMSAIGFYHSHTPALGDVYQRRVLSAARTLFHGPQTPKP